MSYKAFVSSTFNDLKDHRARVIQQLRSSGFTVDPMEDWTADSNEPSVFCLERVRDCQLCVLLLAFRRGHVPTGQEVSITQMEYEYAEKHGIEALPFLLEDSATDWPANFDERTSDRKLEEWRGAIRARRGVQTFRTESTSLDVASALNRWQRRRHERERLGDYLAAIRRAHGYMRFLGLPQLKDNRDIRIDRLFVDPYLAAQYISPDQEVHAWPSREPLLDAASAHKMVVVLGDPGSGKSTLIDWISWQLAEDLPNSWKDRLRDRIPLPLVLRDLAIRQGVTWESLVASFLSSPVGRHLGKNDLMRLLEDGETIILLDGLDEIGSLATRRDLSDVVQEGMRRYNRCHWVLTSRIVGYDSVPFHRPLSSKHAASLEQEDDLVLEDVAFAEVRYVAPFDDDQIVHFAKNWFHEREKEDTARAHDGASNLVDAVHADRATTRLARIPNLLTIMALIYRIRARLPNGKALLYNEIAQAYLESIDDFRKIRETNDTLADKKRWLARVGFEMQRARGKNSGRPSWEGEKEILVKRQQLLAWIAEAMSASGRAVQQGDPERFLDHIKRRSGLVIERSADEFAFTHLSFQEYFAACYLKEQIIGAPNWPNNKKAVPGTGPDDLRGYANSNLWRETLVFLFELIAGEAPGWVDTLVECQFGPNLDYVGWQDLDETPLLCLLARLATDPHAGFEGDLAAEPVRRICEWELARQDSGAFPRGKDRAVLPILLATQTENRPFPAECLVELAESRKQERLNLQGIGVTSLPPLGRLSSLRLLDLGSAGVRDLTPLAGLTRLEELHLSGTAVIDLRPLAGLSSLKALYLSRTGVRDLTPLAGLRRLELLNLNRTDVSDLGPLAGLTSLERLTLGQVRVSDLAPLAGLTSLIELDLSGTEVSNLAPLAALTGLNALTLVDTAVSNLVGLAGLTSLEVLDLYRTRASDLTPLCGLKSLKWLRLSGTVSSDSIARLKTALPDLDIAS